MASVAEQFPLLAQFGALGFELLELEPERDDESGHRESGHRTAVSTPNACPALLHRLQVSALPWVATSATMPTPASRMTMTNTAHSARTLVVRTNARVLCCVSVLMIGP